MITSTLLLKATGCNMVAAGLYAQPLDAACLHYGIDTPVRLAAFLAQVAHESGSFKYVRELAGGEAYEGRVRLGNTEPGDGPRFKGRGLIQITGRDNYRQTAARLKAHGAPDFERTPDALEQPEWAAWSAADWWTSHGCNELADDGDFTELTKRINGGTNGLADRQARWELAKAAIYGAPSVPDVPKEPEKETTVAPFLLAALPSIIEAIPKLGRLFGSGSAVSERNLKAAEMVASTVTAAVGASNEQDAVAKLKADPAAVAAATKAIDSIWYDLTEAGGGGIDGARKASAAYLQPGAAGFWLNPSFWISLILIAMPLMLLVDVLFVHPDSYVGELRTQIVTGVLMVIGMVGGYWIGTSISSAKKDERA